jgi:hypothetical protein
VSLEEHLDEVRERQVPAGYGLAVQRRLDRVAVVGASGRFGGECATERRTPFWS